MRSPDYECARIIESWAGKDLEDHQVTPTSPCLLDHVPK